MLEILKAQVLLAYQELNRYGLDKHARGTASAIDRQRGMIVLKSARDALVADMQGRILEGTQTLASDIQSHIAIYRAFPKLGGIAQPYAGSAGFFAQRGMDIPALETLHQGCFRVEIPCAVSVAQMGSTFRERSIDPLKTPAALVLSHNAYAWGTTALDAVANAAALEETASMALRTMQLDPGMTH